ncbi:MAG: DUF2911 domain-containing protein [Bacteroidota bacterium]
MLKKILLTAFIGCSVFIAVAQNIETPQPSPTQTIKQNFGLSSISLTYSRPGIKGRKIFGDLVPFGKVWRTGANNATTIEFGDDVTIGGTKIPKGEYGLITIPDKDVWTVIITKQLDITNPSAYKPENDLARVTVKPATLRDVVESFTIQFANVKSTSCDLQMMWENTAVALPITTDVDSKVAAQIKDVMEKDNRPYFQAAAYYLENGKDLNQALVWFDKAAEQQPDAYWVQLQRANCLAKLGKKDEARAASQKSRELAVKAGNDDYVKLNDKLLAQLK